MANNHETVHISLPDRDQLCCMICELDFIEVQDSSAKSNFHWQTMKCRLLIFAFPEIIASPILGTEGSIFVITTKEYYKTEKLQTAFKQLRLICGVLQPLTDGVYNACLSYAIQCRIAPTWNKIGQYLVRGKSFYNSVDCLEAVKLKTFLDNDIMHIAVEVEKIKAPFLKLEDFYLPHSTVAEFLANPKGLINLPQYSNSWVYVLPSMKKGKVLSICKEIPEQSAFKDYEQIRRHWKNMYGYSLPKTEERIFYYEVKFPVPRTNSFTYPNICLTSGPLEFIRCKGEESIMRVFRIDLLDTLSNVLGKQVRIDLCNCKQNINMGVLTTNTPCAQLLSAAHLPSPLNTRSDIVNTKNSNIDTTLKLDFSNKYIRELHKDINNKNILPSPSTHLLKIHEIHNTNFLAQVNNTDLTRGNEVSRFSLETNVQGNSPATSKSDAKYICSENNIINSNVNQRECISTYFKVQKKNPCATDKKIPIHQKLQMIEKRPGSLKEKLLNAKATQSNTLQQTDDTVDVDMMARNNRLGELKVSVLSAWLKKHQIPHNTHGKKIDLINKVLSHIRNTQRLTQFRT